MIASKRKSAPYPTVIPFSDALVIGSQLFTASVAAVQESGLADRNILEAIEIELRSNDVSADTLNVQVAEGVVTLSGVMESLRAKRQAVSVRMVGSLRGVRGIIDDVRVHQLGLSQVVVWHLVEST